MCCGNPQLSAPSVVEWWSAEEREGGDKWEVEKERRERREMRERGEGKEGEVRGRGMGRRERRQNNKGGREGGSRNGGAATITQ